MPKKKPKPHTEQNASDVLLTEHILEEASLLQADAHRVRIHRTNMIIEYRRRKRDWSVVLDIYINDRPWWTGISVSERADDATSARVLSFWSHLQQWAFEQREKIQEHEREKIQAQLEWIAEGPPL